MSKHLIIQLEKLKKTVLTLGTLVEESFKTAVRSVEHCDVIAAKNVVNGDSEIDRMELELEEECLHTLALHQPMAYQLRYVVAVLKINNQLERIGDLSVNMAEQVPNLARYPRNQFPELELPRVAKLVESMLKHSLDALVHMDTNLAQSVRSADLEVDEIHQLNYRRIEAAIVKNPESMDVALHMLSISRYLERVGDHAVNVAEEVIYMAQGEILRHSGKVKNL